MKYYLIKKTFWDKYDEKIKYVEGTIVPFNEERASEINPEWITPFENIVKEIVTISNEEVLIDEPQTSEVRENNDPIDETLNDANKDLKESTSQAKKTNNKK